MSDSKPETRDLVTSSHRTPAVVAPASDMAIRNQETDMLAGDGQGLQLRRLHQYMRGYYRLAIVLLALGAAGGGYAGFKSGKKVYSSTGLIRVMAVVPKLIYSVEDKGTMPMFDSFVDSQAAVIQSQRVMEMAMQDPEWQALGRGLSDRSAEDFEKEISVSHEGEMLRVQAVDPDPNAAIIDVRTLIRAYVQVYEGQDAQSDANRIDLLRQRKAMLSGELAGKQQKILDIATVYGSADLKAVSQFQQERVNKLDAAIDEKNTLRAALARNSSTTRPAVKPLKPDQMASMSPELANLFQEGRSYQRQLELLQLEDIGLKNKQVLEVQELLRHNHEEVQQLEESLQVAHASDFPSLTADGAQVNEQQLSEELKILEGLRDTANQQMLHTGADMLRIEQLRNEADQIQADRNDADRRIEQLTVESQINGRLRVLSDGDRPLSPFRDTRVTFAATGGFGGGMLGFCLIAGYALLDRRLRSPDQAEGGRMNTPMLGMLPRLPDDLSDPEQAAMAAHCVHEIRTLLQIWSRSSRHKVFGITSPNPGAGKTSLTMALGASYATANLRTLIVDCDLIAGALTRRAELIIKRMLGQILLRQGVINEQQLAAAVELASATGKRIGQVLLDQGVITIDDLEVAIASQMEQPVGILDAMHGIPIEQCVAQTSIPNLQILPVGAGTARDVPLLSPEALHLLIDALGKRYDVVLVDTGPILGSLEASLISSAVDGVVLVVRKGDRQPLVERAMSQLVTVGARVAGVVFNGASPEDIITYGRANTRSDYGGLNGAMIPTSVAESGTPRSYGPLATAVANCAPAINRNSAPS